MQYGIVVIDIGMTNKKVSVYDEHLVQCDAVYKEFEPVYVRDPLTGESIPTHNIDGMETWFTQQIQVFAKKYPIKALSVTTHGATFVCVDKEGKRCAPCVLYTYEPGQAFHTQFYAQCGVPHDLQKTTYTPAFSAMINLAKGIYFLQQHFKEDFANVATILNYPQYWSYTLTGKKAYEPTFLGCHTYLWEQNSHQWSSVVDALHIRDLMPSVCNDTCTTLGTIQPSVAQRLGLPDDVIVTTGIHDSNASLLPYLASRADGDFILNSTGTWCVAMHPQQQTNKAVYTEDDIGKVVFFNRSALDTPVKTAIFLGGMEVQTYVQLYQAVNATTDFPASDMETVQEVLTQKRLFVLPEVVAGSGQYPDFTPGIVEDDIFYPLSDMQRGKAIPALLHNQKLLWAALNLSMVIQSQTALERAGLRSDCAVYTEGGFRKNTIYNTVLASVLQPCSVYVTDMKEATAVGSALTALMAIEKQPIEYFKNLMAIERVLQKPVLLNGYESYKQEWISKGESVT